MGGFITTRNDRVFKRYLTGDGQAILVRDGTLGTTGGYPSNWYFVPASCIEPGGYDDIALQANANGRYVASLISAAQKERGGRKIRSEDGEVNRGWHPHIPARMPRTQPKRNKQRPLFSIDNYPYGRFCDAFNLQ